MTKTERRFSYKNSLPIKLVLTRTERLENTTLGQLHINGEFFCHTLEDKDRSLSNKGVPPEAYKVPGATCIPAGFYEVVVNVVSPRFRKRLPRLLRVPAFTGVLIHGGNTHQDTDGCILVGEKVLKHKSYLDGVFLSKSQPTLKKLIQILDQNPNHITLSIK